MSKKQPARQSFMERLINNSIGARRSDKWGSRSLTGTRRRAVRLGLGLGLSHFRCSVPAASFSS